MSLGDRKPSPLVRATGSTATNPLGDSGARAIIWMVLNGVLVFLVVEYDIVSAEGLAALETVVIGVSHFLGGLWDRFMAPKLRAP